MLPAETRAVRDTPETFLDDLIQEGDLTIRLTRDDVPITR